MTNFSNKVLVLFILASLCCGVLSGMEKKEKPFRFCNSGLSVEKICENKKCFENYHKDLLEGKITNYEKEYLIARGQLEDYVLIKINTCDWPEKFAEIVTDLRRFANINSFLCRKEFCLGSFFDDYIHTVFDRNMKLDPWLRKIVGRDKSSKKVYVGRRRNMESLYHIFEMIFDNTTFQSEGEGKIRKVCRMLCDAIFFDCALRDKDVKIELKNLDARIAKQDDYHNRDLSDYHSFLVDIKNDLEKYIKIKEIVSKQIEEEKRKEDRKNRFDYLFGSEREKDYKTVFQG